MFLAGVDGFKNGWVIVSETRQGQTTIDVAHDFRQILNCPYERVVVDIPIGLLDNGTRLADREARCLLKQRSCCVFTSPVRPLLSCSDYREANKRRRAIEGKGLTKQAWALLRAKNRG
jgi:predicted RNase H-like nuclease